ncbi:MAG: methyltransferase domain-containing protein, partial [Verrucomicrobia bacterium]|nr:methyltransferase domain-containing protein [Verrucomicrobiota bacterium]
MSNNPHIERLVPSIQGETAMEHLHRYAIASDLAVEKTVLDLACGEGFGSALLAQTAHQVLAVDISEPTIIAASDKYRRENLKFVVGSATKLPIETASMDIVVSFETIEHVAQQHTMLEEIARVLKPDGVLIVSTPEKEEYNSPTISPNPYHARELSRDEFDALLRTFFRNVELFGQRVTYASNVAQISLVPESATCYTTYRGNYNYAKPVPGLAQPRFLLALCSRTELPRLNIGLFEDEVYSSLIVQQAREWVTRDQVPATAQVFISHHGIFDDDHCSSVTFTRQRWRKLRMLLPPSNTSTDARVRLDPGHETSVVEIARVQLQDPEKKQSIWRARTADELSTMTVGGTGIAIPDPRVLRILNVGPDPQVLLPAIPLPTHSPLLLEVLLRVNPAADAVADCFAQLRIQQQSALQAKEQALTGAQSETESLRTQLASLEESTLKQRSVLEAKIEAFESELEQYHHRLEEAQGELTAYQAEVERLDREVWDSRVRRADFAARLREREQWIRDLKRSVAWKLAKPLWKVQRHLSKTRKRNHESHSHDIAFSLDHSGVRDDNPGAVELTGWCFSRRGPAVVGLRAKIERKSYIARYGLKRSDTRSAEGNSAALLSGFYLTFPTPDRTTTVRIEAITHEGGWQLVSTWSMKMLERPPLDQKGASATRAEEKHLFILPARANGSDPVLYPEITSDEAVKTLAPAISRHLAKVEGR